MTMYGRDHPGDFSHQVGWDLYLNPWWGRRRPQLAYQARRLLDYLDVELGEPDLWHQGCFHELLWGPRDVPRNWRPAFYCSVSGGNGMLHSHLWLPWQGGVRIRQGCLDGEWPHLHSGHTLDHEVSTLDLEGAAVYISVVNSRRLAAEVG
jgi:hypothetical protein